MNGVRTRHGRGVAAMVSAAAVAAGLALTPVTPAALATQAAGRGVPPVPPAGAVPPGQDPFYRAPATIGSYAPGQIVATRPVTGSGIGGVDAWQIPTAPTTPITGPR